MKTKKQLNLTLLAVYAATVILVSFILGPIYSKLDSNTLTQGSIWTVMIYYVLKIITFIHYPLVISLTVYSVYRFTLGGNKAILAISLAGTLVRYSIDTIVNLFSDALTSVSLLATVIYTLIDFVIIFVTAIISENLITTRLESDRIQAKASRALDLEYEEKVYLPFPSLLDLKNPVLLSAFIGSACSTAIQIISRIRYDVIFGAPQSITDGIGMVLAYLGDVVLGVVTFLAIAFLLLSYIPKNEKK
jgi:hypothetical protein